VGRDMGRNMRKNLRRDDIKIGLEEPALKAHQLIATSSL
jgi:hypothetical protein